MIEIFYYLIYLCRYMTGTEARKPPIDFLDLSRPLSMRKEERMALRTKNVSTDTVAFKIAWNVNRFVQSTMNARSSVRQQQKL